MFGRTHLSIDKVVGHIPELQGCFRAVTLHVDAETSTSLRQCFSLGLMSRWVMQTQDV